MKVLGAGLIRMMPFEGLEQALVVADLRRRFGIKTPDAIVGAATIVNKLTLVTMDKGFVEKAKTMIPIFEIEQPK